MFKRFFTTNSIRMSKRALVFLAEGAEEMETVITVDTLRRANIDVTLAGLADDEQVLCSRNVKIVPDVPLETVKSENFDAVIVPGGLKGAEACATSSLVGEILRRHYEANKLVAAICAGPTCLFAHRLAFGKSITSYPSFREKLGANYIYKEDRVVQDGNIITSQGPGTSFEFALKIVEYLEGSDKAKSLIEPMRLKL
ncbi:unnamed protein product [Brachionus calyciflorus]|uniref:DJ-1/PfpI domain-containing protein n=1 Tax=Brachionus calyciflorus TaxID=104777 RepID=A0A814BX60_9BILA|nr:unnamed protein product [Brachionus calyciflorus]